MRRLLIKAWDEASSAFEELARCSFTGKITYSEIKQVKQNLQSALCAIQEVEVKLKDQIKD